MILLARALDMPGFYQGDATDLPAGVTLMAEHCAILSLLQALEGSHNEES